MENYKEESGKETAMAEADLWQGDTGDVPPLEKLSCSGPSPLSSMQNRFWFLQQMEPSSAVYNIFQAYRIEGEIDPTVLEKCFHEIIHRPHCLRTSFWEEDSLPYQVVREDVTFKVGLEDLTGVGKNRRKIELEKLALNESMLPFDLTEDLLFRVTLVHLDRMEYMLMMTVHHIVFDGWSLSILLEELSKLYAAFENDEPSSLKPLLVQYAGFSQWQQHQLQGDAVEKQAAYWQKNLDKLPDLQLPTDHPKPAVQTNEGERVSFYIDMELATALNSLCSSHAQQCS